MTEADLRDWVLRLENKLRQEGLNRSEQLRLLTCRLLLSRTRRDVKYGHG